MRKRLLLLTIVSAMAIANTVSVCVSAEGNAVWRYETAGEVSAGGDITVFAYGLEGQCDLISAIYCDGILAEASAAECSEGDKSVSIAVPEEFSNEHVWTLKAFVWDGLSSMKPIADSFEVTLTDIDITDKFTDANFLAAVSEALGKGETDRIYNSDVNTVTELTVTDKEIHSLAGIEYFTALEKLDCTGDKLEKLDISKNTKLKELICTANHLTTLDLSENKELEILDCGYNPRMTSLDVSNNPKLKELYCDYSSVVSLKPLNNPDLIVIYCLGNELVEIDVSNNPKLETLCCFENNLTSLDISNNKNLTYLDCSYNRMKSVDDIKGLTEDLQAQLETFEFNPQKTE